MATGQIAAVRPERLRPGTFVRLCSGSIGGAWEKLRPGTFVLDASVIQISGKGTRYCLRSLTRLPGPHRWLRTPVFSRCWCLADQGDRRAAQASDPCCKSFFPNELYASRPARDEKNGAMSATLSRADQIIQSRSIDRRRVTRSPTVDRAAGSGDPFRTSGRAAVRRRELDVPNRCRLPANPSQCSLWFDSLRSLSLD